MYNQGPPPSGGAMFARQKKTQNSPDAGGDVNITGELLQYILQNAASGNVKLEVSGWRRMGRNGSPYTALKLSVPYAVRNPQAAQQGQPYQRPRQMQMPVQSQPMNSGPTGGLQQTSPGRYTNKQVPMNDPPPYEEDLNDPIPF